VKLTLIVHELPAPRVLPQPPAALANSLAFVPPNADAMAVELAPLLVTVTATFALTTPTR
jgi:hypothetical protein